jgi:hypothetical protein
MTCQKSNGQHLKETTQFLKHTNDVYCFNFVSRADSANIMFLAEMSYQESERLSRGCGICKPSNCLTQHDHRNESQDVYLQNIKLFNTA